MVKIVNLYFEEEEFELAKRAKKDKTWKEFVLSCAKKGDSNEKHS